MKNFLKENGFLLTLGAWAFLCSDTGHRLTGEALLALEHASGAPHHYFTNYRPVATWAHVLGVYLWVSARLAWPWWQGKNNVKEGREPISRREGYAVGLFVFLVWVPVSLWLAVKTTYKAGAAFVAGWREANASRRAVRREQSERQRRFGQLTIYPPPLPAFIPGGQPSHYPPPPYPRMPRHRVDDGTGWRTATDADLLAEGKSPADFMPYYQHTDARAGGRCFGSGFDCPVTCGGWCEARVAEHKANRRKRRAFLVLLGGLAVVLALCVFFDFPRQ